GLSIRPRKVEIGEILGRGREKSYCRAPARTADRPRTAYVSCAMKYSRKSALTAFKRPLTSPAEGVQPACTAQTKPRLRRSPKPSRRGSCVHPYVAILCALPPVVVAGAIVAIPACGI